MSINRESLAVAVCTAGGIGRLRPASGTWGSVAAALVLIAVLPLIPAGMQRPAIVAGVLAATLAGILLAPLAIRRFADPDPKAVVIDEVAGTWLAAACLPAHALATPLWPVLLATLLFRVFDIAKPWPVAWCERLPGGYGIMADDLAAGLIAGILATALLT